MFINHLLPSSLPEEDFSSSDTTGSGLFHRAPFGNSLLSRLTQEIKG